jgi:hypothetical protein
VIFIKRPHSSLGYLLLNQFAPNFLTADSMLVWAGSGQVSRNVGVRKTQSMVDRYAKFATESLWQAAFWIEQEQDGGDVIETLRFCHVAQRKKA